MSRSSFIGGAKFALVAFKDDLRTNIYPVTELIGPKMKVAGATVKVYDDGLLQKGTIVITTDNMKWLVDESERLDVSRYFGLSNTPAKKSTPSRRFSTPRPTSPTVGLNRHDSPSPIAPRRHSVFDDRPAELKKRISPLTFENTKDSLKSRRRTTIGLTSSTPNVQKSKKQEKGKVDKSGNKVGSRLPTLTNKKKAISFKLVQKRITDFFKVQEKQLVEPSFLFQEQNISSFLASYDFLFQQPRSVALPLFKEELCFTTTTTAVNQSFTSSLPLDIDSNDSLTPMELFSRMLWSMEHCKLNDPWMITMDSLKDIKFQSKTPEVFARNLMYRMFNIGELKDGMKKGCLNVTKLKIIQELTFDMFTGMEVSWSDCVSMINDSIRYSILLSQCLTDQNEGMNGFRPSANQGNIPCANQGN
ncbi:hypothetical protein LOTGIDRAFT_154067 [Lottia gigantea]|uniref:Uncharacterized protein n=1 Tax=Lottia gigantea TaxID=225164 RepID=V3ZX97_LOTGI|nr:hypothetical protein LOTGIDRAFT_154067 [Lottia gigantea]ESO88997.1 hypothetical protein LOTGIDRAFT_154067 [Lottia gigantea]